MKDMNVFEDKVLLITGGTGSFGNAVLRRFLNSGLREIRILSRDEKKQDDMRKKYNTRLDVAGMQALLLKLRFMQAIVRGEHVELEE